MIVEIGQQVLMVPLYLWAWGVGSFEDWVLLGAAANFTRLFDFGMEFHFGNTLRLSLAAGDRTRFDRGLSTGITCYTLIMVVIILIISAVALALPIRSLLNITTLSSSEVALVLWVLVLQRTLLLPRPFIRSIYAAHGEFSRGENMYTIFTLCGSLTSATLLVFDFGPVLVAIGSVLSALVACWLIMIVDQRRRYPGVRYVPALPTGTELRTVIRNARFYMLPLWAEKALLQGPILMLGMFVREPGAILMFTLSRTLTGLARQGAIQLARSGGIEMARQVAQQDRTSAFRLHKTLGRTIGGLTGLSCGMLLVAAEPVMSLWTGERVPVDPLIVLAFIAGILFAGPAQANYMLLQLTNTPRPLALSSVLQVVVVIGLCLTLIVPFGSLGAAVAVGLADALAFAVLINEAAARSFGLRAESYAAIGYGAELAGLALGGTAAWLLMRVHRVETLPDLILFFGLWGVILGLPTVFLLLDSSQRSRLMARVRSVRLSKAAGR